jgi:signal transduction histidine kinase
VRERHADLLLALGLLALTALDVALTGAPSRDGLPGIAAAFLIAASTASCRRAPLAIALFTTVVTTVGFAVNGTQFDVPDAMLLSIALVAYALGDRASPGPSTVVAATMVLGTYGAQIAFDGGNSSPPLLYAVGAPWLMGAVVRSRRTLADRLQATIDELADERTAYVELAVERERRSIARDLHDIVGHAMSLIVIQAAAGRHLVRTEPERATDALEAILDAGHQARVEVGRLRGMLAAADDPVAAPGLTQVPAAIARAAAAGMQVHVAGGAGTVDLAPETDHTAFCVVQEALTNAVKHASGAKVDIMLDVRDDHLRIDVRNGPGRQPPPPAVGHRGGLGLRGMTERVRATGGSLEAGPDGDGWRVLADLPCRPSGHAAP